MLGCLKAFAKSGFERKFYDLGRVGYTGPQSLHKVDFGFDQTRKLSQEQVVEFASRPRGRKSLKDEEAAKVRLCGGGSEQWEEDDTALALAEESVVAAPDETVASATTASAAMLRASLVGRPSKGQADVDGQVMTAADSAARIGRTPSRAWPRHCVRSRAKPWRRASSPPRARRHAAPSARRK